MNLNRNDFKMIGRHMPGSAVALRDNKTGDFLHSDGNVYSTCEWWPTRTNAEEILDKYYPEPAHVWVHGDVFKNHTGIWLYATPTRIDDPVVIELTCAGGGGTPEIQLKGDDIAFLFNINDKLS